MSAAKDGFTCGVGATTRVPLPDSRECSEMEIRVSGTGRNG